MIDSELLSLLNEVAEPTGYIRDKEKTSMDKVKSIEHHREEMLKEIAQNIRASEKLRREINKDTKDGADPIAILDKALMCISLMSGDKVFYQMNKERLQEVAWPKP